LASRRARPAGVDPDPIGAVLVLVAVIRRRPPPFSFGRFLIFGENGKFLWPYLVYRVVGETAPKGDKRPCWAVRGVYRSSLTPPALSKHAGHM
jgi:hypothetical protein